jgi:hypothetical protein
MNISGQELKKTLDLIESLDNKHGFRLNDFLKPEPSDLETNNIGWWLKLKAFPSFYFFFREINNEIFIKYLPNERNNNEKTSRIKILGTNQLKAIQVEAEKWLKSIRIQIDEKNRLENMFKSESEEEYTEYTVLDENEVDYNDETELTKDEINGIRSFLFEFNKSIQENRVLPEKVKNAVTELKDDAEIKLTKNPTRKIWTWLTKKFDELFMKYITEKGFRTEVNKVFGSLISRTKFIGENLHNWIDEIVNNNQ